jgi:hypothetical protein
MPALGSDRRLRALTIWTLLPGWVLLLLYQGDQFSISTRLVGSTFLHSQPFGVDLRVNQTQPPGQRRDGLCKLGPSTRGQEEDRWQRCNVLPAG